MKIYSRLTLLLILAAACNSYSLTKISYTSIYTLLDSEDDDCEDCTEDNTCDCDEEDEDGCDDSE